MNALALLSMVIAAAAIFGLFSGRVLRLPITIGTMLLTVFASILLRIISEHDAAVHSWALRFAGRIDFENLILHGMLSLLLFAGSFLLDLVYLSREKLCVGLLSLFGTVFSTGILATLMFWGMPLLGISAPWMECLFFGALISPTDPIAVLEMLHRVGVSKNIQAQLAGESLFNDGIGAVLFLAILEASRGAAPTVVHLGGLLILQSGGGLLLGVLLARVVSELMRLAHVYQVEILLSLALAVGGYSLAEAFHLSAPLEAVAAGLALRRFNLKQNPGDIAHQSLDRFWSVIDEVQNSVLFVLLGLELLVIPFTLTTLKAGAFAVVSVVATRAAVVAVVLGAVRMLQRNHRTSFLTLTWGGLRGGLSLALALSVPPSQGRPWILATTYLVVVFSIVIQGGTLDLFLKRFQGYT